MNVGNPDWLSSVAVRLIRESDAESFHAAIGAVSRELKYLAFYDAPPLASTREYVIHNVEKGIPHYVAVVDGRVLGWCDINPITSRPVFTHSGSLGMGLVAEARGKGLGRALISAAITHAQKLGLKRIELEVYTSNQVAIKLYDSCGFKIEGTKRLHAKFPDRFEDSHFMALLLQ